jgi:hypothetical protein
MLDREETLTHEGMAFGGPSDFLSKLNDLPRVPRRHPIRA